LWRFFADQHQFSARLPEGRHIRVRLLSRTPVDAGLGKLEREMKFLTESYRGLTLFMAINTDRFLVPILIVASLTLAGWLVSLFSAV
jgi:hypothetical protein